MLFTGEKISNIKSTCLVEYANYLDKKKKIDEAIKYYYKALRFNSNNYYAYCGLASDLLDKKQFIQSLEYCKKVNSLKSSRWGIVMLFSVYKLLGETGLANETMEKILERYGYKGAAGAYNDLFIKCLKLGMKEQAENYCKEAVKINPGEPGIHRNLALLYQSQGKLHEAKDEFKNALALTNDNHYKKFTINRIANIDRLIEQQLKGTNKV